MVKVRDLYNIVQISIVNKLVYLEFVWSFKMKTKFSSTKSYIYLVK